MNFYAQALKMRAMRNELLSSNIANADTPGYKARDVDFTDALRTARGGGIALATTRPGHQGSAATPSAADVKYRVPMQPTLDGNTVETDVEQAAYAENAIHYRASLRFLDGSVKSLRFAIKGGE